MKIVGYSERGAVNALLHEIFYSQSPERLLVELLALARYRFPTHGAFRLDEATILVEQSLSDFGDADAILLLRTDDGPMTVFLEARVKPAQTRQWRIDEEYQQFFEGTASQVSSSNVFTQLYHKVRFVSGLKSGGIAELQRGLPFPSSSTRPVRRIGHNQVVLRAVAQIEPFLQHVRYVALVPDEPERVATFFTTTLAAAGPPGYEGWDTGDYGFMCWAEVEAFCRRQGLLNTLRVLEFNMGQIY